MQRAKIQTRLRTCAVCSGSPIFAKLFIKDPYFVSVNHEDSGRTVKHRPVWINVAEIWKVVDFARNGITNWE